MESEAHALEPVREKRSLDGLGLLDLALRRRWSVYGWAIALALVFPPSVSGILYSFWLLPLLLVGVVLRTHRALLYLQLGDRRLALEAARSMVEETRETPQQYHHRLVLCHVLLELGELDRAKEVLGTIDPHELTSPVDRVNYFQLMGNQLARLGDVEGLIAMTEAVGAESEGWGNTRDLQALMENNRAVADILQGRLEDAARRLSEIETDRIGKVVRGVSLNNRAWVELRRGGDPVSALEWAREALRLVPGKSAVQGTYGAALLESGADPAEALSYLEKPVDAIETVPPQERVHVLYYAARAAGLIGDRERARTLTARMRTQPGADLLLSKLELLPGEES